jgi:hypothetical protein
MPVLAACSVPVPPSAPDTALVPTQFTPWRCREFTAPVTVEGRQQQAVGQSCQQPDGSWQVTVNTPGLPQQVYTLPPEAIDAYPPEPYYAWNPWFYGPLFVGRPVFLTNGVRHHHRFHHNGSHKGAARHGGPRGGRK